jgi:hypothetical protein
MRTGSRFATTTKSDFVRVFAMCPHNPTDHASERAASVVDMTGSDREMGRKTLTMTDRRSHSG